MGLQHAIEGIHHGPEDAVPEENGGSPEATATDEQPKSTAVSNALSGAFAHLGRLGGRPTSRRKPVWRAVALAGLTYVVAVNLSYFFVLKPIWARLDVVMDKKEIIQDFLIVRQSSAAVAGFRDGLMRGDERVTILTELEHMAARAGLDVLGEPGLLVSKDVSKKLTEYPIAISLRGSYHEVGEFLSLLESSPRCLLVREVELDARDSGPNRGDVTVVVSAVSWEG